MRESKTRKDIKKGESVGNKIPKSGSEYAGTTVRIVDYDPSRHLVRVVKTADNSPLEKDLESPEKINKRKSFDTPTGKTIKTLNAANAPTLHVDDNSASLRGNSDYGFFSFREGGGNIIKGPLSIASAFSQVKIGGLSTLNPLLQSGFPSTIVTPIPTCLWSLPSASVIKPILKDVAVMQTLVSALGSGT